MASRSSRLLIAFLSWLMLPAFAADPLLVDIVRITRQEEPLIPLSLLDLPIEDEGWAGAQLGLEDNQTTGGFLGQEFELENIVLATDEDIGERVRTLVAEGKQLFLLDLETRDLLDAVDASPDALHFNVRSTDDVLRGEECRASLFHLPPSRAMLADALAQYLAWKRWTDVVLVTGRHPEDAAWSNSLRRAAERYALDIVDEKQWDREPGARRTDSGHHSAQQEIPAFTRFADHDVLLVTDVHDEFGEYLSYRTERPRPVAGTQGLMPTSWHRSHEQWGATQIQRRFEALADRTMTPRDHAAWLGMRSLGEAVTNTRSIDVDVLREFLLSDKLTLAGFKGVPLSFRDWNGQLRQPVLLVAPRMLVTVSPQEGFLHQYSELDTLGVDAPESDCEAF